MISTARIAVASRSFSRNEVLRAEISALFSDVRFNETGRSLSGDMLIEFLTDRDGAITALECLDEHVFAALPNLKVIGKYGVGLDMIDLDAMARHGVALGWTPGVNKRAVAELVIATAINLLRRIPGATKLVQRGEWRQTIGKQLSGRTVGIIGCGRVGKEVIRLLQPYGCRILAYDVRSYPQFYSAYDAEPCELDHLLQTSDIITLHVPLLPSTRSLIASDQFALMRPDAVLINCARGGIVDEKALIHHLSTHDSFSAGLDVFESEPPNESPLLGHPSVLAMPHIGGSSEEAVLAMGRAAIRGLIHYGPPHEIAGEPAPDEPE